MNGYHKAEDRAKMIARGIDPDALPSRNERLFFKIAPPIFAVVFWGGLALLGWQTFR